MRAGGPAALNKRGTTSCRWQTHGRAVPARPSATTTHPRPPHSEQGSPRTSLAGMLEIVAWGALTLPQSAPAPKPSPLSPLPPPRHPPHRERGTRLELSCWSPSSPGEGGGVGAGEEGRGDEGPGRGCSYRTLLKGPL